MILTMPGLRPNNLSTYLAALGLVRIVAEQFDTSAKAWWDGTALCLDLGKEGLQDFLIDEYRPTPILSPWNGGSGYGVLDKTPRVALNTILSIGAERLASFVAADRVAVEVVGELGWFQMGIFRRTQSLPGADGGGITMQATRKLKLDEKANLIQRLRNRLSDEALAWLDAAVVLTLDSVSGKRKPVFPSLLGTGGNDGRYDFSTNFHQHLAEVMPDLGAQRVASRSWLDATVDGTPTSLTRATIGQFDAFAAGRPGEDSSLLNPWTFVLMIEGLVSFASAPVRKLGESGSRAAMSFTVNGSPAGPIPGSDFEEARGELWAPVWDCPLSVREVRHVFSSARTSWNGRTATSAAHMYAALRSSGIDRRVSRFSRFGLLKRNGDAHIAVLLDEVTARSAPGVELGIAIERRSQRFVRAEEVGRVKALKRAFGVASTSFYREVAAAELVQLLTRETELEAGVMLTQPGRDGVTGAGPRLSALEALPLLADRLDTPEYRVAAGLASVQLWHADVRWTMADLLLGRPAWTSGAHTMPAVVEGFGSRPLVRVLSDLLTWRLAHRADDSSSPRSDGGDLMAFAAATTPWQDVHRWVSGELDEKALMDALKAMLALDWGESVRLPGSSREVLPCAALAILQPFVRRNVSVNGTSDTGAVRGIEPDWPTLLAARRERTVLERAVRTLNRSSVYGRAGRVEEFSTVAASVPTSFPQGNRLAAALWVPTHPIPALRRVATLTSAQDQQAHPTSKENAS